MTQTNQHTVDRSQDDKFSLLYLTGHSVNQISDMLDVNRDRVKRALKRTGTPRRSIREGMMLRRAFGP